jgi:phosphoribosylamine--glycine ligase
MRVLIVGGGGREHALAWRLRQEDPSAELFAAPGNPGIAELATCASINATDLDAVLGLARHLAVDWTLVGPEAPLAAGLVDTFRAAGLPIFGPTRAAAMIESSKEFSKSLMLDAGVPTARAISCRTMADAERSIDDIGVPVVINASGLAAGKGVIVCTSRSEAADAAASMLAGSFGDAGSTLLVEEFMDGEELSLFVLTDGMHAVPLPAAQDHKRLLEEDRGPNTGGMGAYCPVSLVDQSPELIDDVLERVVSPTLAAMLTHGTPFSGLLYVGLMLTAEGPKVVEFNCRFGDPETQAVLPALARRVPLGEFMFTIARGERLPENTKFDASRFAVSTVVAAAGYPEHPVTGDVIELPAVPDGVLVFHAGTKRGPDGALVTAGGRVLTITGVGDSLDEAHGRSLAYAREVLFTGKQFRSDIGWRELVRRAGTP